MPSTDELILLNEAFLGKLAVVQQVKKFFIITVLLIYYRPARACGWSLACDKYFYSKPLQNVS
jgi:hypothetical protein